MKTKTFKAITLAIIATLLTTSVAFAQQGDGTGTLTAQGDGIAGLHGNGSITISGNGVLWIRDHAGDATINVTGSGVKKVLSSGWIVYVGFDGDAQISGSKVSVIVTGVDIDLQAAGAGRYWLRGEGTYDLNGQSGEWPANGKIQSSS